MLVVHEHLPLPDLPGRDVRDPRQAHVPPVRGDPRDLLWGGPDGCGCRHGDRATVTARTIRRFAAWLSFSVGEARSS